MGKSLQRANAIERLSSEQSLTPSQQRTALIGEYLYKFGVISGKVVDEELVAIYVEALEGVEERRLRKGLKAYLAEGTKWPWPGDIAQQCEEEV